MKLRKRTKRESIAYFRGYIDSANAAENWLRHHLAADAHDIKALARHLVGAATAGLSSVDVELLQPAPAAPKAPERGACERCGGTGEDFGSFACPACNGSGEIATGPIDVDTCSWCRGTGRVP